MEKIAVILPALLPVPSVLGGAVESIINNMIDENERNPRFQFSIYSEWNKEAEEKSKQYRYTEFFFFKTNPHMEKLQNYWYRFLKKIFKIAVSDRIVRKKMVKKCAENSCDWILFQAGEVFSLKRFSKYLPKEKVLVHAHGMITPIPEVDRFFSYYLSISDYVANYWKSKSKRPDSTYFTWKNCIKTENFMKETSSEQKNILMEKFGLKDDDFVVLYTGRIIPEKGVLELIQSLDYIDNEKVKIIIIGSARFANKSCTTYERAVAEEIKKHKDQVIFTGYVPNEELYQYYSLAHIAVVPSKWEEPAGLVVIEAMAAGKPVVTTGSGGIREYTDENCSLFVNNDEFLSKSLAEKIIQLMNDTNRIKEMGAMAHKKAQEYNMCQYLENLQEIVKKISDN